VRRGRLCIRLGNNNEAMAFMNWLVDPDKGQKIIEAFGKDTYGMPLFFPESKAWKEEHKNQ
jgi:tungstate transport system substrate-binding protein